MARKYKSKSERRRARRIALASLPAIEQDARRQGNAIDTMHVIGPVQQPRINHTYVIDGFTYNSGKSKRMGGSYCQGKRELVRPTKNKRHKQINLGSINAHKRIENPELYKTLRK